jgi:hypothetical protein
MSFQGIYANNQVNVNGAVAETNAAYLGEDKKAVIRYNVTTGNLATAGWLYVILRWVDKAGRNQTHTSSALNLAALGGSSLQATVNVYARGEEEDPTISYEIVTVGVLGSYTYHYWIDIEGESEE